MRTRWSGQRENVNSRFQTGRNRREWLGKLAKIKKADREPPETLSLAVQPIDRRFCGGEDRNF